MSTPNFADATWRKSSRSNGAQACVEVARPDDDGVGVRDSKCPGAGHLTFTAGAFARFLDGEKNRQVPS